MLLEKDKIDLIIPQRAPIVMIDGVLSQDEEMIETTLTVEADNLFSKDGVLTEPGLIENMAQSAAAQAGFHYLNLGQAAPVGFIGAISKLQILELPPVGSKLISKIEHLQKVFNISMVRGTVTLNGKTIASCELKIAIQE